MKNFRAKKSLGQNFLKSEPILKKIVEAGEVSSENTVLEIGPGKGALTQKLLERAGKVIAVEKDNELFTFLSEKFSSEIKTGKLILLNEDILEFSFTEPKFSRVLGGSHQTSSKILVPLRYKIIANIPYNITGAIFKKFLTSENQPSSMVILVQKEVAQRIVARDGKESLLSISVKSYGEPKLVIKVPARYFSPAPKVDSAVVKISNISRKNFENSKNEENFWKIVRLGFAHKRKKLSGNLKNVVAGELLEKFNIKDKRAEDLSLKQWITLVKSASTDDIIKV